MSKQGTYTGHSGQMAVMAELLFRQCNVAIPVVDRRTDVFRVPGRPPCFATAPPAAAYAGLTRARVPLRSPRPPALTGSRA